MNQVYLLVLVLGCSLLEGQSVRVNGITLRENEIQAENPTPEPTTTTSTQQSCLSDVHSVLREMSAELAELKVEQRHTTTAVNNLESRLRASESQVEELKKKSEDVNNLMETLKKENQEELKDLKTSFTNTEGEVEKLKKENQEELKDLKTSFRNTEGEVEKLKKENQDGKVAFSAGLLDNGYGHTGPFSADFPLIYKRVFTNFGKAYNPATGIFTAPVKGVYQFRFSINGGAGRLVAVVLHKNGHHIAGTDAYQDQRNVDSSNAVSLLLEVGDVICLKLVANAWIYDDWNNHCTFSGQLLFSV